MSKQGVQAGHTLVIEFTENETRQTLMIPIDSEGNALTATAVRADGLPLGKTQVDEEILVNGHPQRVIAIAKTFRMRLTIDLDP